MLVYQVVAGAMEKHKAGGEYVCRVQGWGRVAGLPFDENTEKACRGTGKGGSRQKEQGAQKP